MSSKEINNEIDYDDNSIKDSSLNVLTNDKFNEFSASILFSFIAILIWGILGSTCIYWLLIAVREIVPNAQNRKQIGDENNNYGETNILDIKFPFNLEKIPYIPSQIGLVQTKSAQKGGFDCVNGFKQTNFKGKLPTFRDFPYNLFEQSKRLKQNFTQEEGTDKLSSLFKYLFLSSIINFYPYSNYIFYNFCTFTGKFDDNSFLSFLIMFITPFIFLFLFGLFAIVPILSPIINIFNTLFFDPNFGYFFKLTRGIFNKNSNSNDGNKFTLIFSIIFKILLFIITFPADLLVLIFILTLGALIFTILLPIIIFLPIINIITFLYKFFVNAVTNPDFVKIFSCNSQLLLIIFGGLVTMYGGLLLDSKISSFISVSYVLYIIYQLYKAIF